MEQNFTKVVAQFDQDMQTAEGYFNAKYEAVFGDGYKDFVDTMPDALAFGKEALANLLGGMGYFYGPIRIINISDPNRTWYYDEPTGLFTCTPSRTAFPRGFLWDEGFHSQLTCQWSKMLCMDVIAHWFTTIKENGWIPREQMRGKEAESNLNLELAEDPKAGNPPSFMFVLQYLVASLQQKQDPRIVGFLTSLFPRVELWFSWFNSTQSNQAIQGTFMWQDVTNVGSLSSGLDDYPRGYRISQKGNVHADLQLWMITFSKFMSKFIDELQSITNKTIGNHTSEEYRALTSLATNQFRLWCYDSSSGLYTDRIFYTDAPSPYNTEEQTFESRFLSASNSISGATPVRKYKN